MQTLLTVHNPHPGFHLLKVYTLANQDGELIYPIELDNDIFIIKWDYEHKWHCNGIFDQRLINTIGNLIEEHEPPEMFWEKV